MNNEEQLSQLLNIQVVNELKNIWDRFCIDADTFNPDLRVGVLAIEAKSYLAYIDGDSMTSGKIEETFEYLCPKVKDIFDFIETEKTSNIESIMINIELGDNVSCGELIFNLSNKSLEVRHYLHGCIQRK